MATSCAGTGLNIGTFNQIAVVGLPYSVEQLLQWAGRLRESGEIAVFTCLSHHWKKTELSGKSDVPGSLSLYCDIEMCIEVIRSMDMSHILIVSRMRKRHMLRQCVAVEIYN